MFRENTDSDVDIQSTPLCPEDANRAGDPYLYEGTSDALNELKDFRRSGAACVYQSSFPRFYCGLASTTPTNFGSAPNQGSSTPKNAKLQGENENFIVAGFRHYAFTTNGNMYFYSDNTLDEVNAALPPGDNITITYAGPTGPQDPIEDPSAIPLADAHGLGHVYGTVCIKS